MLANGYRASKSKLGAHEATARYIEAVIGGEYAPMLALSTECESSGTAPNMGTGTFHPRP